MRQFKANMLAFHKEATWCDKDYVPSLEEYLMNSTTSSCIRMLGLCIILGMGHDDTIEASKWATKKPKAVFAAETMGRIINDIVGYEVFLLNLKFWYLFCAYRWVNYQRHLV